MSKISKALNMAETFVVVTCMITASGVLLINVVLRYCFNSGFSWTEEYIIFAMVWVAFVGSSICVRKRAHVAMRLLVDKIRNDRARNFYEMGLIWVTIFFSVSAGLLGLRHVLFLIATGQTSAALRLPMYIPYLAIPVGFTLITLRLLEEFWSVLRRTRS
jgi:C4-dicarboxylate transporter, DctQ subunit